jgi:hypothetical protein
MPGQDVKDHSVVFLANRDSELPAVALALQSAGKAVIVAEGELDEASVLTSQRVPLCEGVEAQIRLEELVNRDGTIGFRPDLSVPSSTGTDGPDVALDAALGLARSFKTSAKTHQSPAAWGSVPPKKSYAEMSYPPPPYRVLAAFRIWGTINYFFPYKDLVGEDWNVVLREFIPRMENATNALDYHLAVAEMVTHFHDGHGFVDSSLLQEYLGDCPCGVAVRVVEGLAVITRFVDDALAKSTGLEVGDVVLKVDGEDAIARVERIGKLISASTPQWRTLLASGRLLTGPDGTEATVVIRDRNDQVKELKLLRKKELKRQDRKDDNSEVLRLLPGNIGYADLKRLTVPMVDEMFEKFKDTKAIILDDRGYPQGTAWAIAPRLTESNSIVAAQFQEPVVTNPDFPLDEAANVRVLRTFSQLFPPTDKWRYKGRTVMLIDERAISQAEHTGLFFEAANGTKFIGSPTAGANGPL